MTALLFAISLNPIGAIVVMVLGLLDLICFALTWLFTGEGFSFMEWLTGKIAGLFYGVDVLTKLDSMDFVNFDTDLMDKELGLIMGNRFRVSAEFVGKILADDEGEEEDVDDKVRIVVRDGFWSEKDEQSQAYADKATGDYLWQVDIDEFYQPADISTVLTMLKDNPDITEVSFKQTTFWGGFDHVVDGWYLRRWNEICHRIFRPVRFCAAQVAPLREALE